MTATVRAMRDLQKSDQTTDQVSVTLSIAADVLHADMIEFVRTVSCSKHASSDKRNWINYAQALIAKAFPEDATVSGLDFSA